MPKFAANLTMLYTERAFPRPLRAAAQAGFEARRVPVPLRRSRRRSSRAARRATASKQVLHNLPAGDWDGGERGIACLPDRVGEFREGVGQAIEYATALGVPQVNCLAGMAPAGVDAGRAARRPSSTTCASPRASSQAAGIRLLIEPINTYDIPGFYLNRTDAGAGDHRRGRLDNLFLQYDIYHTQRMEGELAAHAARHLRASPTCSSPTTRAATSRAPARSTTRFLFEHLDAIGYDGWIGCEYKPAPSTAAGLGWLAP